MVDILKPLPYKNLGKRKEWIKRVILYDVREIIGRVNIDHSKRIQKLPMLSLFPKVDGLCRCGCGVKLEGRRTSWASEDCNTFATHVREILCGYTRSISYFLSRYYNYECCKCSDQLDLKIDHIIPVKHNGGGCWLSNYQYLCHSCHVGKTNEDFGWKKK